MDDIAKFNEKMWDGYAAQKSEYTQPWLELRRSLVEDFAAGRIDPMPRPYMYIYPQYIFENLEGKDVLCLAGGGGQQTAVFGLLGANVTSYDLTQGQLDYDREAARKHGYPITTVKGDMRDLSALADRSFDLVYHPISLPFVPDTLPVYREVHRVLRSGGFYRVGHIMPGVSLIDEDSWTGEGYVQKRPYGPGEVPDCDCREFQHLLPDMFNKLIDCGFAICSVHEDPRHLHPIENAKPGTWDHMQGFVMQYFCVVAKKS